MKLIDDIIRKLHGCPDDEALIEFATWGLPDRERRHAEEHLRNCQRCQEQVREYAGVSEGLALSVDQVEPGRDLAGAIFQQCVKEQAHPMGASVTLPVGPLPAPRGMGVWDIFWLKTGPLFAAFCILLGFTLFYFKQSLRESLDHGQTLQVKVDSHNEFHQKMVALLSSPRTLAVSLEDMNPQAAQQGGEACWGRLYLSQGGGKALLICGGLKALPSDQVYVLWGVAGQGDAKQNLGSFRVQGQSSESLFVDLSQPFYADNRKGLSFALTLEAAPGKVESPHGPLLLLGRLKNL